MLQCLRSSLTRLGIGPESTAGNLISINNSLLTYMYVMCHLSNVRLCNENVVYMWLGVAICFDYLRIISRYIH